MNMIDKIIAEIQGKLDLIEDPEILHAGIAKDGCAYLLIDRSGWVLGDGSMHPPMIIEAQRVANCDEDFIHRLTAELWALAPRVSLAKKMEVMKTLQHRGRGEGFSGDSQRH